MLLNHGEVFSNKISKIYYTYNDYQSSFSNLSNALGEKIVFVQGFSWKNFFEEQNLNNRTADSDPIIIVLDDTLHELLQQKDAIEIFTR